MITSEILEACGLGGADTRPVPGGDINSAFCARHRGADYFIKVNDAALYPAMFLKEANALKVLKATTSLCVPEVISSGEANGKQYLVLSWLEAGTAHKDFWQYFGQGLADLHRQTQNNFGWMEDNYIGSLHQSNSAADSWSEFYAGQRLLPLIKKLYDKRQMSKGDSQLAEKLCCRLDDLFPEERPALLHGDLWSGNFMISDKGPAIYDPAAYYGHREMDLGMSLLFGGFAAQFYEAYEQAWPPEKGWRQRVPLTQLYPLLVHACLFGSAYAERAGGMIRKFA